jgi:hypothetical protein
MHLDFVVPGFSKSGTTTLCSLLNEHPDLYIPRVKELNFFAWKWERGWAWYESFFYVCARGHLSGEGSEGYASAEYAEQSASRMAKYFPQTKLIFLARNPISRLASSFREMHHNGHVYGVHPSYSLGTALRELPNMMNDTRYWKCINVFRRYFPEDQIHVEISGDFMKDPAPILQRCFRFLGVNPSIDISNLNRNLNSASDKLYDTRLMRAIRTNRLGSRVWNSISLSSRDRIESTFRLRKPFREKVHWDQKTLNFVREQLEDDAGAFLEFYGKPADFWDFGTRGRNSIEREEFATA